MILIKTVKIVDCNCSPDEPVDILISGGKIIKIADRLSPDGARVIEAKGLIAIPGIVDTHVHLREPGYAYKETVESASRAAAAGGVTTVCAMPNVLPCPDSKTHYEEVISFQKKSPIRIIQSCAVNRNLSEERSDWEVLSANGARFFTNDGLPVDKCSDMAAILEHSRKTGCVVAEHAEVLGTDEITSRMEEIVIARDLMLNERIGGRLHIQHISTKEAVSCLSRAKRKNVRFTAETCPHYFIPTEKGLHKGFYEVFPPLRDKEDRQAILWALSSGLITVLASDHAPHTTEEKTVEKPARGVSGVELLFPLCYDYFVKGMKMRLGRLLRFLVEVPSTILGIDPVCFKEGKNADIALFDPNAEWTIEASALYSKGKNTAFLGKRLSGKIVVTIASGKIVYPFEEQV
jgi:dihydroorotase